MEKSLTKNALLNIAGNGLNILFPLISFPYIARVLGPESIGEVNYILSVMTYFTLFSSFGIPIYATRELAKLKNNKQSFENLANEMFLISLLTSLVTYAIFIGLLLAIPQFKENALFFLAASFLIIFNTIGLEWLYQALEEFSFITYRSMIIKSISLVLLFVFVQSEDDKMLYLVITVFGIVGSHIFNLIYSKRFITIRISRMVFKNISKHLKPLLVLFFSSLVASIYLGMDILLLGSITNDYTAVGYYYAAIKINRIAITILASVSLVVIPRMSFLVQSGDQLKYKELLQKMFDINILFALPLVCYLLMFSEEIILILSGPLYTNAIITMQLITPIILTAAVTNVLYNQVLIPNNKENVIIIASLAGVVTCFLFNYLLVPHYAQNGTAVATLLTEIVVMAVELGFVYPLVKEHLFSASQKNSFIAVILMALSLLLVKYYVDHLIFTVILSVLFSFISYFGALLLLKDKNLYYFLNKFKYSLSLK
ncbi:flippase [Planococcus glaciei]|uniref:flippase n=1 Tax=Planococcus glaciei TaxID=459472 RepID=UPI001C731E08|nr:flippase [Planococcus glaciei]MBX0313307.1 flippase [Planococcus glaciei]